MWDAAIEGFVTEMQAQGRAPRTIGTRLTWINLFREHCGVPPGEVTRDHVIAWMADNAHWRPATRRATRHTLRVFFVWATAAGICTTDPAADLPPVRLPAYAPRPVDEGRFRAALADPTLSDSQRLALMLAGLAGLRRDEIVKLRGADLDSSGLWVTGKGGRTRVVPVGPELREAIEARGGGWLFPARWGDGHMNVDALGKMIRRAFDGQVGPHRLRHRFATAAYRGTRDLRAVQTLLGHANATTTQLYVQVSDEALATAVLAAA